MDRARPQLLTARVAMKYHREKPRRREGMSMKPDDRRGAAHWDAENAAMDTYSVRVPRWPILLRLSGRDPLVRTTDRVQALVSVLTVVATLLAAPIAAAVGTEVYDSRRDVYSEQVSRRDTVTATVTDVPAPQRILDNKMITVEARWSAAGTEHTGTVGAPSTVEAGDRIEIWVDDNGAQVPAPSPTTRAAVEAVTVALVIWVGFAAASAAVFAVTLAACDRMRSIGWQHDLDSMVGHGDGHHQLGSTSER
jgi:hypothetical protein